MEPTPRRTIGLYGHDSAITESFPRGNAFPIEAEKKVQFPRASSESGIARLHIDRLVAMGVVSDFEEALLRHSPRKFAEWKNQTFPRRNMRLIILIMLLTLSGLPSAAETVTTTDGRTINLKTDGTYEIIQPIDRDDYQEVDIVDLEVDAAAWVGKNIKVRGTLVPHSVIIKYWRLYQHAWTGGVTLKIMFGKAPKSVIRKVLKKCLCKYILVLGNFNKNGIELHSVILK